MYCAVAGSKFSPAKIRVFSHRLIFSRFVFRRLHIPQPTAAAKRSNISQVSQASVYDDALSLLHGQRGIPASACRVQWTLDNPSAAPPPRIGARTGLLIRMRSFPTWPNNNISHYPPTAPLFPTTAHFPARLERTLSRRSVHVSV